MRGRSLRRWKRPLLPRAATRVVKHMQWRPCGYGRREEGRNGSQIKIIGWKRKTLLRCGVPGSSLIMRREGYLQHQGMEQSRTEQDRNVESKFDEKKQGN
jgi:hypothetical protein